MTNRIDKEFLGHLTSLEKKYGRKWSEQPDEVLKKNRDYKAIVKWRNQFSKEYNMANKLFCSLSPLKKYEVVTYGKALGYKKTSLMTFFGVGEKRINRYTTYDKVLGQYRCALLYKGKPIIKYERIRDLAKDMGRFRLSAFNTLSECINIVDGDYKIVRL